MVAVAALLIGSVGGAAASSLEQEGKRSKFVRCGKVDLGFTEAKMKARGMKCKGAKGIFKKWQRKVRCPKEPCRRTQVENFTCRFRGSDVLLRLRCRHDFRDKTMKMRWGG